MADAVHEQVPVMADGVQNSNVQGELTKSSGGAHFDAFSPPPPAYNGLPPAYPGQDLPPQVQDKFLQSSTNGNLLDFDHIQNLAFPGRTPPNTAEAGMNFDTLASEFRNQSSSESSSAQSPLSDHNRGALIDLDMVRDIQEASTASVTPQSPPYNMADPFDPLIPDTSSSNPVCGASDTTLSSNTSAVAPDLLQHFTNNTKPFADNSAAVVNGAAQALDEFGQHGVPDPHKTENFNGDQKTHEELGIYDTPEQMNNNAHTHEDLGKCGDQTVPPLSQVPPCLTGFEELGSLDSETHTNLNNDHTVPQMDTNAMLEELGVFEAPPPITPDKDDSAEKAVNATLGDMGVFGTPPPPVPHQDDGFLLDLGGPPPPSHPPDLMSGVPPPQPFNGLLDLGVDSVPLKPDIMSQAPDHDNDSGAKAKEQMKAEADAKAETDAKAAQEKAAAEKAKTDAEAKLKEDKAKAEAEAKLKEEKAKAETEAKLKEEKAKAEAEAKLKEEKAKAEAEAKLKEEKAKAEAEAKLKEEKAKAEAEAKSKEEQAKAEAKLKEEKAKAEAEAKLKEDKAKAEAEAKKKKVPTATLR